MRESPERFRRALEAFLSDEARARVARWRGEAEADPPAIVLSRHRFLGGRDAVDVLGELVERGRVRPAEAGALAAHLARYTREHTVASVRHTLRALATRPVEVRGEGVPFRRAFAELWEPRDADGRRARLEAVERVARSAAPVLRERRVVTDEAVAARKLPSVAAPDAGPAREALVERAESFLRETKDLLEEGLDWAAHRRREPPREAFDLLLVIRAPELDDAFPPEDRYRRFGAFAASLGLERELVRRVRVDARHGGADPRARLAAPRPPFDVRIAPPTFELGAITELGAAYATGRALALCLVHPELPVELRYPLEGTVPRAMGTLVAQWAFDDARLARERRAPEPVLDAARRLAALAGLLSLRVAATSVTLRADASPDGAGEAARRAIGLPCSPSVAVAGLISPTGAAARLRGELHGLALWWALRDRFDIDWYRNPRARDVVRGAGERGGGLAVEALAAELGVAPEAGVARLREWFRG